MLWLLRGIAWTWCFNKSAANLVSGDIETVGHQVSSSWSFIGRASTKAGLKQQWRYYSWLHLRSRSVDVFFEYGADLHATWAAQAELPGVLPCQHRHIIGPYCTRMKPGNFRNFLDPQTILRWDKLTRPADFIIEWAVIFVFFNVFFVFQSGAVFRAICCILKPKSLICMLFVAFWS